MFRLKSLVDTFNKLGHCPMTLHCSSLMKNCDFEWKDHMG